MTNEEKARELAFESPQCQMYIDNKCNQNFPCDRFKVALKMAQWKDEQMKEALNNILIECDACFDEQTTNTLESIIKHQIEIL